LRREGDWFAEPPDLEDDPEFDDSDPWLSEEPIGEPPEDMAPWPPEEADSWEPDAPTSSPRTKRLIGNQQIRKK
jgi:hypothetical protein